jgi:outer membrane biosynthesis protein TonB
MQPATSNAELERSAGRGFDEQALEAARQQRFESALQGGVPSAARIRFR